MAIDWLQGNRPMDYSQGLASLSGAVDALMQRRIAEQHRKEEMEFRDRQQAANEAHWAAQVEATKAENAQKNEQWKAGQAQHVEERAQDAFPHIFESIGKRDPDTAKAWANSRGIQASLVQPTFDQLPEAERKDSNAAALANEMDSSGKWDAEPEIGRDAAAGLAQDDRSRRMFHAAMVDPTMRFMTPGGQSVDYRVNAPRDAKDRYTAEEMDRIVRSLDPISGGFDAKYRGRLEGTARGLAAAGDSAPDALKTGIAGATGQEVQDRLDRRAAANAARLAAKRTEPKAPDPYKDRDDARADLQGYLSQSDYKGKLKSDAQFRKMLDLASANNAFTDRALIGSFVKMAQGDAGVLSDSDIETFWNKAGSPAERTQNYVEQALNGRLGAERREQVRGAIGVLSATAKGNLDRLHTGASTLMERYGEDGDRYVRSYFGVGLPSFENKRNAEKPAADHDRLKGMGF